MHGITKLGGKKSGKTRLRESQSLNRITEVQEDPQAVVVSTTIFSIPGTLAPKVKSVGSKILQGLSKNSRKTPDKECIKYNEKLRMSRRDTLNNYKSSCDKPENCNKIEKCGIRKIRLFGKYFHVHKKLCIPLSGFLTATVYTKLNHVAP